MSNSVAVLSAARYGKTLVKVARVKREGDKHSIVEYSIQVLLSGDIETSYTKADNSVVVATDSIKNTVNIFAKTSPYVFNPPVFALHLATHFVTKYPHIHSAHVELTSLRWSRISVGGKPHNHAFVRGGDDKDIVKVDVVEGEQGKGASATVQVGLKDLLVLKTTGSAFEGFLRDEYTTLGEVKDRIFSTSVEYSYTVNLPADVEVTIDNLDKIQEAVDFNKIKQTAREVTLSTFATDESASVQATIYNTAEEFLKQAPAVKEISYSYPNKHYIPINLSAFKLDNGLGYEGGAEVFHPAADPSGLITATISRK